LFLIVLWFIGKKEENRQLSRQAALSSLITGLLALLFNLIISTIWFRPRPFVTLHTMPLISHSADASFPSDHTAGSMGLAGGTYLYRERLGVFFGIFSILIGFARVYVGVHYPSDVLGGFIVGIISTMLIGSTLKWWDRVFQLIIKVWFKVVNY